MVSLPTGTVTFLFSDIQGSTQLWQTQPDAMRRSHARHNEILQGAIEAQGGYVFQVIGDAYCSAFHSADAAVRAAIQSQRALHAEDWGEAAIRVRMGIHTGKADLQEDGQYSGYSALSRVQRVMAAGHGGQTLISSTSEQLLRGGLPAEAGLRHMGECRLKDMPQPEHLFQLVMDDLPADFPPLRTMDSFPNNLPLQLTSFVGREKELADVKRLLGNTHLLTLVGPGGTGKSRLSLQAATDLLHTFAHGAWLVELAPVSDPAAVPAAVLAALELPAEVHRPAIDMLCDHLHDRELLLILDNCEHLLDACARLVDRLLHAAPNLRILASSREALGIGGEVSYRVPSMGLPDMKELPTIDSLSQYEAVRLFIARAAAAHPGFSVTNANAPAVAQICHRLDGIPLAIELAAAKLRALSVDQIAKRLDDRFRLLTGGSRTALERHQTLRAALDWSHNLLAGPEQVLFRRLSTFVNGWTLEAAEGVCAGDDLPGEEVLGLLEQLVNKSLVTAEEWRLESRYSMLETMRQYAGEKLLEAGESTPLREHHLAYFLELAENAAPHLRRPEQVEWLDRLEAEHDNLRLALEWSLGRECPESALRLSAALAPYWDFRYYWKEGARWLESALAMPAPDATLAEKTTRLRALCQDACLAELLDDVDRMQASAEAALAICGEGTELLDLGLARFFLGFTYFRKGDPENARRFLESARDDLHQLGDLYWEALAQRWLSIVDRITGRHSLRETPSRILELARKAGERRLLTQVLGTHALLAWLLGEMQEAQSCLDEAVQLNRELDGGVDRSYMGLSLEAIFAHYRHDYARARGLYQQVIKRLELAGEKNERSNTLLNLGMLERDAGNLPLAQARFEQALELAKQVDGGDFNIAFPRALLGQIHFLQRDPAASRGYFKEVLRTAASHDHLDLKRWTLVFFVGALAEWSAASAAQVLAAVQSFQTGKDGEPLHPLLRSDYDNALVETRLKLGEEVFQAAWKEGEKLSLDDAIDLARRTLESL